MKTKFQNLRSAGILVLLMLSVGLYMSSCVVTARPAYQTRTVVVKQKKGHPHGMPPGQAKKSHGHPGKKH